ncbi:Alpha/Beta hydrolase protein [Lentinula novae-zelandiae]|nr:Alpha/Beta hydrolase protein [Lentinula novae-zelandiae]
MSSVSGTIDFPVGSAIYHTWYKIYGDLKSECTPLVVVHGGPGMTHHYIPVIFYDQIGNGASSLALQEADTFWTPKLFMDELNNLVEKLGISGNFNLLGHSWGGMLVGNYAAERVPKGLKRIIIANAPSAIDLYERGTRKLLNQFPDNFADMLQKHELEGTMDSSEFQEGMMKFNQKHICTVDPWPQNLIQSFNAVQQNPHVYSTMWGHTDWNITGTLRGWSVVDILPCIKAKTLLISAPFDEVQDIAVQPWFSRVSQVKWVEMQNSTHLPQFEEPERYFDIVSKFLLD